jgi:hypothetical protein
MATYFAKVGESNTVLQVIVSGADFINSGKVGDPSTWVECFLDEDGVINPKKQYPGRGYNYDSNADIFYPEQPYPSWTLDGNYDWQPPIPKPEHVEYDGNNIDLPWLWDEDTQSWST